MNAEQEAAVKTDQDAVVVVASPGAGKTRTLVERVNHLLKQGVDPKAIVVITFTNAAAGELLNRLYEGHTEAEAMRLGYVGTLHGWVFRVLSQFRGLVDIETQPTIIDEEAANAVLDSVKKSMGYKGTKTAIGDAFRDYPHRASPPTPAELVVMEYRDRLRRTGMFDFNTLLSVSAELMKQISPSQLHCDHLLIDEAQDSAKLDWQIYDAAPVHNRFIVADPDQAIYGFRGGKVDMLLERCRRPHWQIHKLEINYRSDVGICVAAQNVIAHNKGRFVKRVIANSKEPGKVIVTGFDARTVEYASVTFTAKKAGANTAILLRYNAQVDSWCELLTKAGVPLQRRRDREKPADWSITKLLISIFASPHNEEMVMQYLAAMGHDPKEMAQRRLRASREKKSLAKEWGMNVEGGPFTPHYAAEMTRAHGRTDDSVNRVKEIAEILPAHATMADLLVSISSEETRRDMDGDPDGVHVLTMHGSKGLEFDHVFLPESDESMKGRQWTEEDRRLFYVAMTRARHELIVTHSRVGVGRDCKPEARKPLPFVLEMSAQPVN